MRQRLNAEAAELKFREVLARHGLKWTAERRTILAIVRSLPGHFTADDLAGHVQRAGAGVSRATVYRALPLLVEAGLLQPMVLGGEVRRFENALSGPHHDHLVCTACGRVVEIEVEAFEILQREVAARHGFRLSSHVHELYGTCAGCQRTSERSADAPAR